MNNLYNCDFNDIVKGLNDLSNYSGFKDEIINLLKNAVGLLATQDSYVKALLKNNKDLRRKNNILSRNADTAFQDGLNESREVYKSEVKSEVKAEICQEFADKLKAKAEREIYTDIEEVKHGHWIDKNAESESRFLRTQVWCSVCGKRNGIGRTEINWHTAYCPNCGAKMDEGERKDEK